MDDFLPDMVVVVEVRGIDVTEELKAEMAAAVEDAIYEKFFNADLEVDARVGIPESPEALIKRIRAGEEP